MIEKRNLVFSSALENLCSVNSSFDKGVLRVAYHGRNRNKTAISKQVFENCIDTIYNCPIVCHYLRESDSIGGHDVDVVRKENYVKLVNVTQPVGVIPESAKWWWQEVTEDDGEVHEYLCAEALLWKRQEAYAHLKQNAITDQSMEVTIHKGSLDEDGYYNISQFEFTAFCLLERDAPCFESAGLETFSRNYFTEQYSAMMEDFKREFTKVNAAPAEDVDDKYHSKGGVGKVNLTEMMAKYGLTETDIDFDMTDMTAEELEAKFAEIKARLFSEDGSGDESGAGDSGSDESDVGEPEGEPEEPEQEEPEEDHSDDGDDDVPASKRTEGFSLTNNQMRDELHGVINACRFQHPEYGDMPRYWMLDFNVELGEVYVEDTMDWRLYGLSFTMNGDTPVVDFESRRRKKVEYVDWAEGSVEFSVEEIVKAVSDSYTKKIGELENDNKELLQFKNDRLNQDRRAENDKVFNQFPELVGNETFEALKERMSQDCYCLTIEDLEDKCFAIRGRCGVAQFSLNTGAIRLPIEKQGGIPEDEPYGGAFVKFGKNRK